MSPAKKDLPEDGQEEAVQSEAPDDAEMTAEVKETQAEQPEASVAGEAEAEPEASVADEAEEADDADEAEQPEASVADEADGEDEAEAEPAVLAQGEDPLETPEAVLAQGDDPLETPEEDAAPAKPARRRAAAAKADDDAPKPRTRKAAPAKPKRKPAEPKFGLVDADLPADLFDAKVNVPLIHQVVVAQQAAARQGTHSVKSRGDVRGGGRKPYRQKGTGRARQGSIRAPQFAGGGIVHGPVPRSYEQKTPKKMKAAALRGALSDRARHGFVQVVGGFVDGADPKTREALAVLHLVTGGNAEVRSVLVVAEFSDQATWKSLRNAVGVHLIDPGQLNTYDVLVSDRVVFTSGALASFVARAGGGSAKTVRAGAGAGRSA